MDAERLVGSFNDLELSEVVNAAVAEMTARGLQVPEALGSTAIASTVETPTAETPSSTPEAEVTLSPELTARLEQLSPEYHKAVVDAYSHRRTMFDRYISDGKLPEDYRMPELATFMDKIEAGASTFEHLDARGFEPHTGFVPRGLTDEQWGGLLSGYDTTKNGTWTSFDRSKMTDPTKTVTQTGVSWGYAVVSTTDRPVLTNVAKDGKSGSGAKTAITTLREMPNVPKDATPEQVIALTSPTEAAYRELQLARVEAGDKPVDGSTWTLAKENVVVDRRRRAVWVSFDPSSRQVWSSWNFQAGSDSRGGVRPSAEW